MKIKTIDLNAFVTIIVLTLAALKLDGFLRISWVLVIAPLWILCVVGLAILIYLVLK